MDREIKFREPMRCKNCGAFRFGYQWWNGKKWDWNEFVSTKEACCKNWSYELIAPIEQFTGLKDWKDWYAGDIIQKGEIIRAITVDWEHGMRFMLGKHILCKQDAENGKKIGNIHENKDLLSPPAGV